MSRTRDLADLLKNSGVAIPPVVSGKNLVINGAFDHWQRGTSIAMTTTNWGADRWGNYRLGGGATISRQSASLTGFQYCARMQRDSGNTSAGIIYIGQPMPIDVSTSFIGQTVTFSYWARKGANFSAATSLLRSYVYTGANATDYNGFHGSYTSLTTHIYKEATLTDSWQRFTATGTLVSGTQILIQFEYTPVGTAGAADYCEITGVQLELGSVATPFSRAGGSVGGELSLCQRYYEVLLQPSSQSSLLSYTTGVTGNTSYGFCYWYMQQTKRTSPTLALGPGGSWNQNTPTIFSGPSVIQFYSTGGHFYLAGTTGATVFTASAEL